MKNLIIAVFLFIGTALYAQQTVQLSHYVFPEFKQGVVLMKNGQQNKTLLNYNSLSEEVVFNNNGTILALGNEILLQVDTVFIGDKQFVWLKKGFKEILLNSGDKQLFAEHKCRVIPPGKPAAYGGTSQTSSAQSYSSILSGGRVYDLKLPDDYKVLPGVVYWIGNGEDVKSFGNLNQLRKIYKDKRNQMKEYTDKNKVEFADTQSVKALIDFLESN